MAAKRMDLNKRTFFVLSGIVNPLGKCLASELCRRFQSGSIALLIDSCEEQLAAVKKELQQHASGVKVISAAVGDWQQPDYGVHFAQLLEAAMESVGDAVFERAFILHNEGQAATHKLMEPQDEPAWIAYLQEHLYAPVALNQAFLHCDSFAGIEKLVVNVTSSLQVLPYIYNKLMCSCKKARDMYFRAMATEECRNGISVLTYAPGIMETHVAQQDLNDNIVDLEDVTTDADKLTLPRVTPLQSSLKLINILEEISFISGHDVDYYDTFFL